MGHRLGTCNNLFYCIFFNLIIPCSLATGLMYFCHSALDAESSLFLWIPAFAGMTNVGIFSNFKFDALRSCRRVLHLTMQKFFLQFGIIQYIKGVLHHFIRTAKP